VPAIAGYQKQNQKISPTIQQIAEAISSFSTGYLLPLRFFQRLRHFRIFHHHKQTTDEE
jgi:hypothetical protein